MARVPGSHPGYPGSVPGQGIKILLPAIAHCCFIEFITTGPRSPFQSISNHWGLETLNCQPMSCIFHLRDKLELHALRLGNDQTPSRWAWFLSGWRDVEVTDYKRSRWVLVSHRRATYHGTMFGALSDLGWLVCVSTTGPCEWRWERGDGLELVREILPQTWTDV